MYLNEKAWEAEPENLYEASDALKNFLDMYKVLAGAYGRPEVYVPSEDEPYFRSVTYSVAKWLSEVDIEYRRLYLSFWNRRCVYTPDDEYEVYEGQTALRGGTEAVLNDSFMLSICLDDRWERPEIPAVLFSLADNAESPVVVRNVFSASQLAEEPLAAALKATFAVTIYTYEELWERRSRLFPHLRFCPSVRRDLENLEKSYIRQIVKKLSELEEYSSKYPGLPFRPEHLTKTTPESDTTMEMYQKQHTFRDENDVEYQASWHMRFTGIPGRIFFVPDYTDAAMLICYIGKKLPNASYPT